MVPSGDVWKPKPGTTWQWDLSGDLTMLDVADVYDIDGFETDAAFVGQLHAMGKKVIVLPQRRHVRAGPPETPRTFPKEGLGKYWRSGDTYIDIRSDAVRAVIGKRLDMCKAKGRASMRSSPTTWTCSRAA